MLNLFLKSLLLFGLFSSAHASAEHYNTVTKTNTFSDFQGVFPLENQILLYSEFISSNQFHNNNTFYKIVETQLNNASYEMAFVGRGAYKTRLSIDQLSEDFFQNIANIQYLLGPDYEIQAVDESQQNFTFQSARDLPFVSDLVATVYMHVLENNEIDTNMLTHIQNLTGRNEQPQRLIIQDMNSFNKNVLFARMITALYPNANQGTDVEVLSVSVFYDFPSFGRSFIESSSEADLRGYAERLYGLGDNFKISF